MSSSGGDRAFMRDRELSAGCSVREIVESMRREQRDHENHNFPETYLKYRKVVGEWMVDVCEYFTLHQTTTHAAICYLDRLQPNEKFTRFEWQMLAICCILIASKYNESEEHVPDLSTLEEITQQTIANETVLNYELWALKRMGWKLNARTPMAFLSSYMVLGILLPSDRFEGSWESTEERLRKHCQSTALMCCLDAAFKGHLATDVAAAILLSARKQIGVEPAWRDELTEMTGVDLSSPSGTMADIVTQIDEAAAAKAAVSAVAAGGAAPALPGSPNAGDVRPPAPPARQEECVYRTSPTAVTAGEDDHLAAATAFEARELSGPSKAAPEEKRDTRALLNF